MYANLSGMDASRISPRRGRGGKHTSAQGQLGIIKSGGSKDMLLGCTLHFGRNCQTPRPRKWLKNVRILRLHCTCEGSREGANVPLPPDTCGRPGPPAAVESCLERTDLSLTAWKMTSNAPSPLACVCRQGRPAWTGFSGSICYTSTAKKGTGGA